MRATGTATHYGSARDKYPSSMFPPPIEPRKPYARFLFAWADAVTHHETLTAFVHTYPDEFPSLSSADPVSASVVTR